MRSVRSHAESICPSDTPQSLQVQNKPYPTGAKGLSGDGGNGYAGSAPGGTVTALGAARGEQFSGGLMRVLRIKRARRARLLGSPRVFAELG